MTRRMQASDERDLARLRSAPPPAGLAQRVLDFVRSSDEALARLPELAIEATAEGVSRIGFGGGRTRASDARARRHVEQAREELAEYFGGERGYFSVPIDLSATRPFQRSVLEAALRIPLGEVRSYAWVAEGAGHPGAVRATGSALGTNPVPLIVPCHRVIRTDGSIGGYGGGLPLKRRLLLLESGIPALVGCTSTKTVCRAGCSSVRGRSESERVVFASLGDARAAGYRRCAICRPE